MFKNVERSVRPDVYVIKNRIEKCHVQRRKHPAQGVIKIVL